ncbi:MAG: DUF1150 family protein [Alphaproteobacteria bacterium]|nr:DUF1150 family protein [Alphaproteobacteria bacterium]
MTTMEASRIMTDRDLASLGLQCVAYVKSVTVAGQNVYSIHAADGTEIAIMCDRDVAFATIREHDMEAVSAH